MENNGNFMEHHGYFMEHHGNFMENHGRFMEHRGNSGIDSIPQGGTSWNIIDTSLIMMGTSKMIELPYRLDQPLW